MMLTLPLILTIISCLIYVTLANNGCNDAMLTLRISNTDFPALLDEWDTFYDSTMPEYTVVRHCRAHSFTSPKWLESTILALKFVCSNQTFYTVLHYNSCNETTSMFDDPIVLINITALNSTNTEDLVYITNNTKADFCYDCTDNVTSNYCQACDSTCNMVEDDELEFCYGPSSYNCCRYIENDNCVASCTEGSSVDGMSTCIPGHLCMRDDPCVTGSCTVVTATTYNCTCPDTHVGLNCSLVNPCNNTDQCNYNGNCSTSVSDPYFICYCVMGINGDRCQYNEFCTASASPCMNGGTCNVTDADSYTCSCENGYEGVNCEISLATAAPLTGAIVGAVVAFVVVAMVIVLVVIIFVLYFFIKGKKGKVEISKKTSKVYPTNGNGTIAEKEPMLDKEKQ